METLSTIRDCSNCHKDFCECVQASMKQWKKERRDKAVTAVTAQLKKQKVSFDYTSLENVVRINTGAFNVLLSLKSERDKNGFTEYKYKVDGKAWSRKKRDDFFNWLRSYLEPEHIESTAFPIFSVAQTKKAHQEQRINDWEYNFYNDIRQLKTLSYKQLAIKERLDQKMQQ